MGVLGHWIRTSAVVVRSATRTLFPCSWSETGALIGPSSSGLRIAEGILMHELMDGLVEGTHGGRKWSDLGQCEGEEVRLR